MIAVESTTPNPLPGRGKTDRLCCCATCGLVYTLDDRKVEEYPRFTRYENGDVWFRGRACTLCHGLKKVPPTEYRLVVIQ